MGRMKIVVDRNRCEANQVCMRIAPEVFRVDENDQLHLLIEQVGPDLQERVARAVNVCPRQALTLVDSENEGEEGKTGEGAGKGLR